MLSTSVVGVATMPEISLLIDVNAEDNEVDPSVMVLVFTEGIDTSLDEEGSGSADEVREIVEVALCFSGSRADDDVLVHRLVVAKHC